LCERCQLKKRGRTQKAKRTGNIDETQTLFLEVGDDRGRGRGCGGVRDSRELVFVTRLFRGAGRAGYKRGK
jgi:hypothetical protein